MLDMVFEQLPLLFSDLLVCGRRLRPSLVGRKPRIILQLLVELVVVEEQNLILRRSLIHLQIHLGKLFQVLTVLP